MAGNLIPRTEGPWLREWSTGCMNLHESLSTLVICYGTAYQSLEQHKSEGEVNELINPIRCGRNMGLGCLLSSKLDFLKRAHFSDIYAKSYCAYKSNQMCR